MRIAFTQPFDQTKDTEILIRLSARHHIKWSLGPLISMPELGTFLCLISERSKVSVLTSRAQLRIVVSLYPIFSLSLSLVLPAECQLAAAL